MRPPEAQVPVVAGLRGWPASRLLKVVYQDNDVCVCVTLSCLSAWPKRPDYLLSPPYSCTFA